MCNAAGGLTTDSILAVTDHTMACAGKLEDPEELSQHSHNSIANTCIVLLLFAVLQTLSTSVLTLVIIDKSSNIVSASMEDSCQQPESHLIMLVIYSQTAQTNASEDHRSR